MGPLDMKGLLGAATVMGTLMHGAGHVWAGRPTSIFMNHELSRSPSDESLIDMPKQNCCLSGPHFSAGNCGSLTGHVTNYHKVRRLHLIVVDLWRPWKYNTAGPEKSLTSFGSFGIAITPVRWTATTDTLVLDQSFSGAQVREEEQVMSLQFTRCQTYPFEEEEASQ